MVRGLNQCSCGRTTRRVIERMFKPERVEVPKETAIPPGDGFVYMYPSHYASDGMCKRCVTPDEYYRPGKQS